MKISVVMPAYDEAGNVDKLAARFYEVFKKLKTDFELVYVLQGSKENSGYNDLEKMRKAGMDKIRIIHFPNPIGVYPAFKVGFDNMAKDATHVLTLDADLNHQPEELPRFIEAMEKTDADIVVGSRYIPGGSITGMPGWKRFLSRTMNHFFNIISNVQVNDKTSGYRLMKREVTERVKDKVTFRNFESYVEFIVRAQREGFSMTEVPITFIFRTTGVSKMRIINTTIGYIKLIARTSFRK
jgi:dolichol-phosphate mannosyltransferase